MTTTDMCTDKSRLGLYIHIPFCRQKCLYCDFCSVANAEEELKERYVCALASCIRESSKKARGYEVDTVYIGGGTPTVLSVSQMERVLGACFDNYSVSPCAEISCECNPATGGKEYFSELRRIGVNRLSIGLQSADDNELRALGRIHGYDDFVKTFKDARSAGFDNLSLDLMYGIPEQTAESFKNTLEKAVEISPEHISAYCLKVEENTPFGKMADKLKLPSDDEVSDMYELCSSFLADNGYDRYEISNFARDGKASRHNLRYWRCEEYLGFGAGAHSYFGKERFAFSHDIKAFANGEFLLSEREKIDNADEMLEFVMLGMRLSDGISLSDFRKRFGADALSVYPRIEEFVRSGHVLREGDILRFSEKGIFVSSYILSEILDFS